MLPGKYVDFEISTYDKNIDQTVAEIVAKIGW